MLRLALAAALTIGLGGSAWAASAADAAVDNVCLVTFSNPDLAAKREVRGVAAASVLPRETAQILATPGSGSVVYTYADLATTVKACQCLNNPAPATSMAERDQTLLSCAKPNS